MPELFSSKSGLTRTATRAADAERARDGGEALHLASDSRLTTMPAATAGCELGVGLARARRS